MLLTIALVLAILWLLGVGFHVAAGFVHLLIVIAVIVVLYDLITRNRK